MRDISEFAGYSSDTEADMTDCLNNAAASGEEVHFGSREYKIKKKVPASLWPNACVRYRGDAPLKWIGTGKTRFTLGAELANTTAIMCTFQGPSPTGPLADKSGRGLDVKNAIHIEGIIFDGREYSDAKKTYEAGQGRNPNLPTGSGSGLLDIAFYSGTFIKRNKFLGGLTERYDNRTLNPNTGTAYQPIADTRIGANTTTAGWIDTLFGTHQCFQETIEDNVFIGGYDCGVYDSGQMNTVEVPYGIKDQPTVRAQYFKPLAEGDNRLVVDWPDRQTQTWVGDKVVFSRNHTIQGLNFLKDVYYEVLVVGESDYVIRASSGVCVGTPVWTDRARTDGSDGGELILWHENQQETTAKHAQFIPVQYGQALYTVAAGSPLVLVQRANHGLQTGQRIWPDSGRTWDGITLPKRWCHVQKIDNNSFVFQAAGTATAGGVQINNGNNFFTEERTDYLGLPSGFMASVSNNYFAYCGNAASYKRSFQGVIYDKNKLLDCGNGLKAASVGGPTYGTRMMASLNMMERIEGQALILAGEECIATGNVIKNVGRRLTNPEKPLSVSNSTVVAAISIVGASAGMVSGNVLRNVDTWGTLDFAGGSYNHGVGLTKDTFEYGTQNVTVESNHIEGFGRAFFETPGCDANRYIVGVEKNCLAPSQKNGANSTLQRLALNAY
ncbi:hypothetical protein [Methylorubrum sp. SB2]|uniref:hypothetical protein n=1 Tax=Methylorubrum subtropicum TaxID=3138812 RepID=UPI00313DDFC7